MNDAITAVPEESGNVYMQLAEVNEHEGETWYFYIPVQGNEVALEQLRAKFTEWDSGDDPEFYLAEELFTETEVDILVKHGDEGYMAYHNKLAGILPEDVVQGLQEDDGKLYKGNISRLMISSP